ncbi:interleukin-17C [Pholidichthys leucotaenia]
MAFPHAVFPTTLYIKAQEKRRWQVNHLTTQTRLHTVMDVKQQVLLLLLFLGPVRCSRPCYNETELEAEAQRRLSRRHVFPALPATPAGAPRDLSCPVGRFSWKGSDDKDRSLSPWTFETVENPDHFPSSYSEAKCLCNGCIMLSKDNTVVEMHNYNSKPIFQKKMFLAKKHCSGENNYTLETIFVDVAVGCTCVRPVSL